MGHNLPFFVFAAPDKDRVKELVWENGGTFEADLDSKCTHLVCGISSQM